MGLEILFWIWILTWIVKRAGTDVIYALQGQPPSRVQERSARTESGQAGRYGVGNYFGDLKADFLKASTVKRRELAARKGKTRPVDDMVDVAKVRGARPEGSQPSPHPRDPIANAPTLETVPGGADRCGLNGCDGWIIDRGAWPDARMHSWKGDRRCNKCGWLSEHIPGPPQPAEAPHPQAPSGQPTGDGQQQAAPRHLPEPTALDIIGKPCVKCGNKITNLVDATPLEVDGALAGRCGVCTRSAPDDGSNSNGHKPNGRVIPFPNNADKTQEFIRKGVSATAERNQDLESKGTAAALQQEINGNGSNKGAVMAASGETTHITSTRKFFGELDTHVKTEILPQLEQCAALLASKGMDPEVVGKITGARAMFASALASLADAAGTHDDKNKLMEEAVNNTTQAAETDYYKHR